MNLGIAELPQRCDVLVVGAGPAGSAAAQWLARAGRDVLLVDQHAFPRDKVCGDGLIADALRALDRLGVREQVLAEARRSATVGCIGPRGGRIDVPGSLAVLPRKRLDEIVCRAAVAAGARMFAPLRFVAPLREGDRVVGAELEHAGVVRTVRATWMVLATGAQPQATLAAGLCERRSPSGIALRGYIRNPAMTPRIAGLEVVWHKCLSPGYGWIFPCGDDLFNIGVGVAQDGSRGTRRGRTSSQLNLREAFAAFQSFYPPARELVEGGEWQGTPGEVLKGAPLRYSLEGATVEAPGVLVCGEAAGSTYALTGEGIGKAMETALHAAEAILADGAGEAVVRADYRDRIAALRPRFALYAQAHRAVAHPWLVDLLVWSAQRSPRRLQRLAGFLEETYLPRDAMSVRGVLRRIFDRR
ncbi:MAG: NAD(P)/FAD-dependent oxidoreductase [Caldimonas sp.]